MELLTLCRSCMVEVASWELQDFDGNAVEMFIFCTNIEISEDDKLPKQFCCDCKIKINTSYEFVKKAQEVNKTLKNLLCSSETSVTIKSENLTNDLQDNESNSLEPDSGFSFEVKIDKNEEKLFSSNSNPNIEYKMEFGIYQTTPEHSENELDESLSNKDFDLPDPKPNLNTDYFNKPSDIINDDEPHIVQKTIISKKDSNCTNNTKRLKRKKYIKIQKQTPELEISMERKTTSTRTRLQKSHKFTSIEEGNEKNNEGENFFQCDICKQRYKYKKVLLKHLTNKHSKTTKEKGGDRPKVQEEKGDNNVVNTCNICSRTFKSNLWFSRHMKEHSDTKQYFCKHCPKTFYSIHALEYHTRQHAESRRFACGECGARFKQGKQLAEHALAQAHALPHVCTKCGAAFQTKSILASHMNSHLNERRFLCGICGYNAKVLDTLNNHMLTHSDEKPFACKQCAFRTSAPSSLRLHERRHRGERPHACQHCGKRFYERGSMARHIRQVHTGETPFQCYLCPQAFTDHWKCKLHIKRAHSIPFEEIPRFSKNRAPKKETVSQPT